MPWGADLLKTNARWSAKVLLIQSGIDYGCDCDHGCQCPIDSFEATIFGCRIVVNDKTVFLKMGAWDGKEP